MSLDYLNDYDIVFEDNQYKIVNHPFEVHKQSAHPWGKPTIKGFTGKPGTKTHSGPPGSKQFFKKEKKSPPSAKKPDVSWEEQHEKWLSQKPSRDFDKLINSGFFDDPKLMETFKKVNKPSGQQSDEWWKNRHESPYW